MSEINASQLLSQLQAAARAAQGMDGGGIGVQESAAPQQVDFSQLLKNAIDHVNESQREAGALKKAFELGERNVDIAQVMVASQKAGVEFQLMLNVRNQLISAYKDIMSMQI